MRPVFSSLWLAGLLMLAACASNDDGAGDEKAVKPGWPSLAPRVGEASPLVPRVPLGACAGCGPDAMEMDAAPPLPAMADLPAPEQPVLPGDIEGTLLRIGTTIDGIEARAEAARREGLAAIAAAGPGAAETEADVQASRFEALFQPLGPADAALLAIEAVLPDAQGGAAYAGQVEALRARLRALEAVRAAGLGGAEG